MILHNVVEGSIIRVYKRMKAADVVFTAKVTSVEVRDFGWYIGYTGWLDLPDSIQCQFGFLRFDVIRPQQWGVQHIEVVG